MEELKKIIRDIKAIAFHISNQIEGVERKKEGSDIKMDDLTLKLKQIEALFENLQQRNEAAKLESKPHYNVAIVSVIDKEFDALNNVFKFKKPENQIKLSNGLSIWKSKFKQKVNGNKELTLLFAKIGNAGNLSSYVVTDLLLKTYEIDLILLCGIAAGNKDKAKIYSSVIGKKVIYYESQKLKADEVQYRWEPLSISTKLSNEIEDVDTERWRNKLLEILKYNKRAITKKEIATEKWITTDWKKELEIFKGGIFAGEKLLADGKTLQALAKSNQIGKDIFAGEMEGYGFAFACKQNEKSNWLVIRGVSDFGGKEKSTDTNEKHQVVAAYSAVALAYDFLENIYSPISK